jgi:hypothetical protein
MMPAIDLFRFASRRSVRGQYLFLSLEALMRIRYSPFLGEKVQAFTILHPSPKLAESRRLR